MPDSLIGGAVLGAVFGELLKKVMEMRRDVISFKTTLKNLESTLQTLHPAVMKLEELNYHLGRPKEELQPIRRTMEDGIRLVHKCSQIHSLDLCARFRYRDELNELGCKLKDIFTHELPAQMAIDAKENSLRMARMASHQDEVLLMFTMIHSATHTGEIATGVPAETENIIDQVVGDLYDSGLESCNLIIGIDFSNSNERTGRKSFNGKSLHHIGNVRNPYEQAISIIGKRLSYFDEDNKIPCFGFGDASTTDKDVFSFHSNGRLCNGFEEVLSRYRELVPRLRLAGPTSFAPVIEMAMTIVEQSGGNYHILLLITDGQMTRSGDQGSVWNEHMTIDTIVKASAYPLSIILVGVGDGPWDMMKEFDDNIPERDFDNFEFVNFTEIMSKKVDSTRKETEFALAALKEIPTQFLKTIELGILSKPRGCSPNWIPVPPPHFDGDSSSSNTSFFPSNKFR